MSNAQTKELPPGTSTPLQPDDYGKAAAEDRPQVSRTGHHGGGHGRDDDGGHGPGVDVGHAPGVDGHAPSGGSKEDSGHLPGRLTLDRPERTHLDYLLGYDAKAGATMATPHQEADAMPTTPTATMATTMALPMDDNAALVSPVAAVAPDSARLPEAMRGEIIKHGRLLGHRYRADFEADAKLRDRASRLFRHQLPPKPRHPGRPQEPSVDAAIRLDKQFQRDRPHESPQERWERIAQVAIPGYGDLSSSRQSEERTRLRKRKQACERQRQHRRRAE